MPKTNFSNTKPCQQDDNSIEAVDRKTKSKCEIQDHIKILKGYWHDNKNIQQPKAALATAAAADGMANIPKTTTTYKSSFVWYSVRFSTKIEFGFFFEILLTCQRNNVTNYVKDFLVDFRDYPYAIGVGTYEYVFVCIIVIGNKILKQLFHA